MSAMKSEGKKVGGRRPGAGRPRKYGRAALHQVVNVQGTREQEARWKKCAKDSGEEFQDWIRKTLDEKSNQAPQPKPDTITP